MNFKVFIPTAGIGSRLKTFTKKYNKSLLPINYKPLISHIIEKCPKNCDFVIALGHEGDLVKQYLRNAHPKKKFSFVKINNYKNKGSSLGLTMSCAKKYLQSPFVFAACDTLVLEKICSPKFNWLGYSFNKDYGKNYRSLNMKKNKILEILEKKKKKYRNPTYIGLAGIKDYKDFWKNHKKIYYSKGEVGSINKILKTKTFQPIKYTWYDTGTVKNYNLTRQKLEQYPKFNILDKLDEKIFFVNNRVIKYSSNSEFINKRFIRSKILKNFVPYVDVKSKNFYSYEYIDGEVISKNLTLNKFKKLLKFSSKFWKKKKLSKSKTTNLLFKFYKKKTENRIRDYLKKNNIFDKKIRINSLNVPRARDLLKKINWDWLCQGEIVQYHGDYHFENILFSKKKKNFFFLDWRQDFQGSLIYGDIYYDLAKLLHGMIVSHNQVVNKNFSYKLKNYNQINISIKTSKHLKKCKKYFYYWLKKNNYDIDKVKVITSLIFLNIASLHHKKYDNFLFNLGKISLYKVLLNKGCYEKK